MRLLVILTILNISLMPQKSHAFSIKELKEDIRPTLEQYLGKEYSDKILGEKKVEIPMPDIPQINANATSTDVYRRRKESIDIPPEKAAKLNYAYLVELFMATRMSEPTQNDIAKWMNVLNQGSSREGIYRALVLDNTYASLENYPKPVTQKVMTFADWFLSKFVRQSISAAVMKDMNFFTLKRVVVEKSLEIIDAYGDNIVDLRSWYGILSTELAIKYPYVWNTPIRADENYERHKNWAENVPKQHLKSEVVIKLHKVFNKLSGL